MRRKACWTAAAGLAMLVCSCVRRELCVVDFVADEAAEVKAELKKALGTRPPPRIRYVGQRILLEYDSGVQMSISIKPLLIQAVRKGDLAEVKRLLSKGMSPDTGIPSGWRWNRRVIHVAAERGHRGVVEALVRAGADIDTPYAGMTALELAAGRGHERVVRFLISAGANVNAGDSEPLETAATCNYPEIVSTLIAAGADPNPRPYSTWTPLHGAVHAGAAEAAALLIHVGAEIDAPAHRCWREETALHFAARGGNERLVALLIGSGADVNKRNRPADDSLDGLLLPQERDVKRKKEERKTPLELAATEKHMGVVGVLIAAGTVVPGTLKNLKDDPRVISGMKRLPRMLKWARRELAAAPKRLEAARIRLDAARKAFKAAMPAEKNPRPDIRERAKSSKEEIEKKRAEQTE